MSACEMSTVGCPRRPGWCTTGDVGAVPLEGARGTDQG